MVASRLLACLTEDALLALLEGRSSPEAKAEIDRHLDSCDACLQLVAAATDELPVEPGPEDVPSGAHVGRYLVLSPIGAGGMGIVYSAYDPELGRQVALKLVRPETDASGQGRERLLREAKAMARLSHPNVVGVHDAGAWGNQVFIAMELVPGGTIAEWLRRERRTWREIVAVFVKAGEGLLAAHRAGLVHRDFKPDNVLIGDDGRVQVTDFGLARADGEQAPGSAAPGHSPLPLSQGGMLMGSPAYMSPEQLHGSSADVRSDLFSFCVALYECLYGRRPFEGASVAELRQELASGRLEFPSKPKLPAFLRRVLQRGLRSLPGERYPGMAELLADLERGPVDRARRRWAALALAGLFAAAAALVLEARLHDPATVCPSAAPELLRVWNDGRKQELLRAFRTVQAPYGSDPVSGFIRSLDAYGSAWAAMRLESCEACRIRHEQDDELLRLRTACLDEHLSGMAALVDVVIASASTQSMSRLLGAGNALPPLSTCANVVLLRAGKGAAPIESDRLRAARRAADEARARRAVGNYRESFEQLEKVREAARSLHDLRLEASALLTQGQDLERLGEYARSEALLHEAALTAELVRADDLAAQAFTALCYLTGNDLDRLDDAIAWARFNELAVERLGSAPDLDSSREMVLGAMLSMHGRAAEALPHLELALRLVQQLRGPGDAQVADAAESLAVGLSEADRDEEALALYRQNSVLLDKLVGKDHPRRGGTLVNVAESLRYLGRPAQAEEPARTAVAIFEASLGPDHPSTANSRAGLALVLCDLGRAAEALPVVQRAAASCAKVRCPKRFDSAVDHALGATLLALDRPREARAPLLRAMAKREEGHDRELGESQLLLAQALWAAPPERARALALARRVVAAALGGKRVQARASAWLAMRELPRAESAPVP